MGSLDTDKIPSIYFGGCSFGAAFYIGVYKAMVNNWGMEALDKLYIGGDSVGSVFALGLGLRKSPEYMENLYREVSVHSLMHGPIVTASLVLEKVVREMLTDPNAYKQLEGRIFLGTTAFFSKHRWHLSWKSNNDLIDCIKGSFNIPFYCARNPLIKGISVLDGAYSFAGIDLPHGDNTLFIGIDPHAEVTRTFTNSEMFFPPTATQFDAIEQSGVEAFEEWNKTQKLNNKVGFRRPNYKALYVLWLLKYIDMSLVQLFNILRFVLFILFHLNRVKLH